MARQSAAAAPQQPRGPAWKELVAMLAASNYVQKSAIVAKLNALGYNYDKDNVSYVMTSARRRGNLCVFTGKRTGYTATPDGLESLVDIRKRRRISRAWIRNATAVVKYVQANLPKLSANMTTTDLAELRKEVRYHGAVLKNIDALYKQIGVK